MGEPPVKLFLPPSGPRRDPVQPLPVRALPALPPPSSLLVGVAVIGHSGRVRDRLLMSALGWHAGDRIALRVLPTAMVVSRATEGPFEVDQRDQVFIPAGTRALFHIASGDRVVLVAAPEQDLLIIHPLAVVTDLLVSYYASLPGGGLDVQ